MTVWTKLFLLLKLIQNLFRLPSHLLFCGILCLSYSSPMCIYHNSSRLPQNSVFLRLQLLILFILHNVYSFTHKENALFPHRKAAHTVQILQLLVAILLAQRKCHILQGAAEQKALGVWKAWKAEKSLGGISWGFTPWKEVLAIPLSKKGLSPLRGFFLFLRTESGIQELVGQKEFQTHSPVLSTLFLVVPID